ncbi:MAG: response regulator [Defluviitaleaceae bacterium]|nr:response regulator [Defluviitaleaceae bacterium]
MLREKTEQKNEFVHEDAPVAIMLSDKHMNPIDCNEMCVCMYGYTEKDEYLNVEYTLNHPPQPDGRNPQEVLKYHFNKALTDGYSFLPQLTSAKKDGMHIIIETHYTRVKYRGEHAIVEYTRDITHRQQIRDREREAHEKLQQILDSAPLIINQWDEHNRLIKSNKQALEWFKVSRESEYIDNFLKFAPEYQPCGMLSAERAQKFIEEARIKGAVGFEWMGRASDGELIPTYVNIVCSTFKGKAVQYAFVSDLRPIKALEDRLREQEINERVRIAEESNRAKSRFLARMSHEIRTPITAVIGISEIELQNPGLPSQLEESLAKIHSSADLLLSIVNDVLDLSKIEAGKMELFLEEYSVTSMISTIARLHTTYSNSNIKFRMSVDENLPASLLGDNMRIEQIVSNLLSNAFKYTDSGMVELSWGYREGFLVVSVKDTGLGMTPEQLEILLSRGEFMRFHEHENKLVTGTGLGMSIVCNLLQLMGARIDVKSEVGKGTSATVCIPQKGTQDVLGKDIAARLENFEEISRGNNKKFSFVPEPMPYGKVLIVDDVEANIYVATGLLAFYDLNVETCTNGFDAVEKIKQGATYDIIFMDYMMPGMNGVQALKKIRELGYKHPIVALTANALIGQAEEFIRNGFDNFISKPIQTKHLNTILHRYVRDKQPPEVLESAKHRVKENIDDYQNSAELQKKLKANFLQNQKNAADKIRQAISVNDITEARLLAHSLKGVSGLIREHELSRLAESAEYMLADGKIPHEAHLSVLEIKLNAVLASISETESAETPQNKSGKNFDNAYIAEIFAALEPLLESQNVDSLIYAEKLNALPQAFVLCKQIEEFDYSAALQSLKTLKQYL